MYIILFRHACLDPATLKITLRKVREGFTSDFMQHFVENSTERGLVKKILKALVLRQTGSHLDKRFPLKRECLLTWYGGIGGKLGAQECRGTPVPTQGHLFSHSSSWNGEVKEIAFNERQIPCKQTHHISVPAQMREKWCSLLITFLWTREYQIS